ncbi:hypothetical protein ONZ45_g1275 [Pleurotus djamor]|nr:hypothetical protein ONZ45_g1275 [Pleurotus djamor]
MNTSADVVTDPAPVDPVVDPAVASDVSVATEPTADPTTTAQPTPPPARPSAPSQPVTLPPLPPKPDFPPGVDNSKMTLTPWKKPSLTILLIGETGVGKTAFLDLLANVCSGRKLEQFTKAHITSNEAGGSGIGSQTNKPSLYKIIAANGYEVKVLDTPGLADTRGTEFDNQHKQSIAEAIRSEIETIDSVIVLANGTNTRLGVATQYALTVISGMFPHSIVDNIAFVFTMVSNPLQFNFKRDGLPLALRKAKIWTIDNPLAGWFKYQDDLHSEEPPEDFILEEMRETVDRTYEKTIKTLNNFFQWQTERVVQATKSINDLYQMSTKIEASITNVLARITQTENQKSELIKMQADIDEQKQIQKVNEQFQTIIDSPFHEHEGTGEEHNTLCCAADCYSNCHEVCQVTFTLDRDIVGRQCQAFDYDRTPDNGYKCIRCGHSSLLHQHYKAKWVVRQKKETSVDEAAKARYEDAKKKEGEVFALKQKIDEKIQELQKSTEDDEEELSRLCTDYNKLALSGSFVGYISQAIALLQMRYDTMVEQGAKPDALLRMKERMASLEKKKSVVEQAMKDKAKASKKNFFSNAINNFKTVVMGSD